MSRTFDKVDGLEFLQFVAQFPWRRRVTEVHLHHTWKPRQSDYKGLSTIIGMWRHHTQTNGWSDIGQHVSIAPDGDIWLCRNFNWAPASAKGFNGNSQVGPFMIEMIGDFDQGKEVLEGAQLSAVLTVIKAIQERFDLQAQDLRFHNEMSSKSCPGTAIKKADVIEWIKAHQLPMQASRGAKQPLFPQGMRRSYRLMAGMNPDVPDPELDIGAEHELQPPLMRDGARGAEPSDEAIEELTDHIVNMARGRFSDDGRVATSPIDVDRIFTERLAKEVEAAKGRGEKLKLLFYAHGGLVSEKNALIDAANQLGFWKANRVYPIFFIWETGFAETLKQMLGEVGDWLSGGRGWFTEATDNIVEELARALQGPFIWGAMKSSAQLASETDGAAAYVAKQAKALWKRFPEAIEIHAVGHSAGSIFHSHFLPELIRHDIPVKSSHFLAPAITNDAFIDRLKPHLGKAIEHLTVFTMTKRRERDDTVSPLYRKSLLYLIYEALEPKRQTDILGLEISLRSDARVKSLFGLGGSSSKVAEVVWSPSPDVEAGSGSNSETHGGFNEDVPTMESVARRILELRNGQPIPPFPPGRRSRGDDFWLDQADLSEALLDKIAGLRRPPGGRWGGPTGGVGGAVPSPGPGPAPGLGGGAANRGTRRALCIGINKYERAPLRGCVNDAELWATCLTERGFTSITLLRDEEATGDEIRRHLRDLVHSARPGDVLVFQYAGHGTTIEDTSGDEAGSDSPATDECLCGIDCDSSHDGLVVDDELRMILDELPAGAQMTCFFDCCHSGTINRVLLRGSSATVDANAVARYLPPSPEMKAAYRRIKARSRQMTRHRGAGEIPEVVFSACRSTELAYERNGQGDFTLRATEVMRSSVESTTNRDVHDAILRAFGSAPRQHPELDCAADALRGRFLAPLG